MDSEDIYYSIVIALICATMSIGMTSCTGYYKAKHQGYVDGGYEQVMEVGHSCPLWKKAGDE